jgi:hypothetical protein
MPLRLDIVAAADDSSPDFSAMVSPLPAWAMSSTEHLPRTMVPRQALQMHAACFDLLAAATRPCTKAGGGGDED